MQVQDNPNIKPRILAFYLPQYHPIPENDKWWGSGFTEWTNVAKARPLFRGHRQPHLPGQLGFYDLRLPETRVAQADLARQYGIDGFCYYHYWFAGRRILERPFNEVLASGVPRFPFCLCWANNTWTGIWHGAADRILIEQTYPGDDDHRRHFEAVLPAFRDPRYIRVDAKPLFMVYTPKELPNALHFANYWRQLAKDAGLPGLYLVGVNHDDGWHPAPAGFDARLLQKLPPLNRRIPWRLPLLKMRTRIRGERLTIHDYATAMSFTLRKERADCVEFPCVIPNWDNTPRSRYNGLVLVDSNPELFERFLGRALEKCEPYSTSQRIVFIKSWNEWAEGNYIEPDRELGRGYLEAIRNAVNDYLSRNARTANDGRSMRLPIAPGSPQADTAADYQS